MRIGMILDSEFPPDSRVENEALSLIEAGHTVFILSISYDKKRKQDETINGIYVSRAFGSLIQYKLSALAYTVPLYHHLLKSRISTFLDSNGIEVIHIHDIQVARAVFWANNRQLPVVLDMHENRPEIMKYYRHVNAFPGSVLINPNTWRKYQNQFAQNATRLVVVTEEAKQQLVISSKVDKEKIIVVPNTIRKDVFFNYPKKEEIATKYSNTFNLLYLGDTGIRRGTLSLIQAVGELVDRIPELKLILVGKNNEDPILKEEVSKLNIDTHVSFEGWQDVSLFPSYISAANLCFSPLLRNAHHDTTFANKVFQYMAGGKPLIVSDCPPQANLVSQTGSGKVHEAGNVNSLANTILELYQDRDLRTKMGENAHEAVANYWNWENTSTEFINMYSGLANL